MNRTAIPWCDYTWNPITGCSPASPGCDHCYAAAISRRFHLPWGHAVWHPERLREPARVRKPGRVFVCSMGDIGHETVYDRWREAIRYTMLMAPWHTYIVLTKRPGSWLRDLPEECWVGVTIESERQANRWDVLRAHSWTRCPVRFVSIEPMLGPVTFAPCWPANMRPNWVIAGPETGPGARPCRDEWIDQLAAESPCFFDKRPGAGRRREWPKREDGQE